DQLKGYACLDDQDMGLLLVLSLLEGQRGDPLHPTRPELAVYHVSFERAELLAFREELEHRKTILLGALENGQFAGLPLCASWKCGTAVKTVLESPKCVTCSREFETQWGINKHIGSKAGRGHDIVNEKVKWNYVSRCKWYTECNPQAVDKDRGERNAA